MTERELQRYMEKRFNKIFIENSARIFNEEVKMSYSGNAGDSDDDYEIKGENRGI